MLGTVPLIVFGLALEKKIDDEYRNLYFVAAALILLAFVLMIAESRARQTVTVEKMTFRDAMIVGLAQALAVVPGASRSGCTITAGLFLGLTREDAARFSFLLSIPAITLAGLYKLAKTLHQAGRGAALSAVAAPTCSARWSRAWSPTSSSSCSWGTWRTRGTRPCRSSSTVSCSASPSWCWPP